MSKIFISYRREDTEGSTGRLNDRLVERFGRDSVEEQRSQDTPQ